MRRSLAFAAMLLLPSLHASAETILSNDSVGENFNGTTATAELIEGEMYEAVFDIPEDLQGTELLGVQVVMVEGSMGGEYCAQFGIEVWEEGSAAVATDSCNFMSIPVASVRSKEPGTNIFSQELDAIDPMTQTPIGFEIVGDATRGNATIKEMRFAALNQGGLQLFPIIINSDRIRVGVKALSDQCTAGGQIRSARHPVLLSDTDGVSGSLRNLIYGEPIAFNTSICPNAPKHYAWEDFGPAFANSQPGDWVMRLIFRGDQVTPPDMGMGGTDMGSDMGAADMGSDPMDMGAADMGSDPMDMGGSPVDMGSTEADLGGGSNNGNNNPGGENNGVGATLMVESITPSEAGNDGSTAVVIVGVGFAPGVEVLLDAESIGVTETRSERIRATVPEGLAPGTYDVIVTNPDGASDVLADGFTVLEADQEADPDGDSIPGGTSDGCCSQVDARRTTPGAAFLSLLLAGFLGARRRRRR